MSCGPGRWHALLDARRSLGRRVDDLEYGLSDANLRQMPDFETRVQVLQSMAGPFSDQLTRGCPPRGII